MSRVLAVAEARRDELRPISLELAQAGTEIKAERGGRLVMAIIDAVPERYAHDLALIEGVDDVLCVSTPVEHFHPEIHEQALASLIESQAPDVVLTGMTVDALGFAPAVAATLGLGFAGDVTEIRCHDGTLAATPDYGGKVEVELDFPDRACVLLMVREGAFKRAPSSVAPSSAAARARYAEVDLDAVDLHTEHLEYIDTGSGDRADIDKAAFVLAIGRGIGDQADLERFEKLAKRLGATLAVSAPLVEAGLAPSALKVGQSGKSVSPKVYLALGISGAAQHLAGIRDAETIIAINTDQEAPIFRVATYGAVADLFDIADGLAEQFDS